MPSVLTGANLANRELLYLGVSGDGDSASIGLGQFAHAMRRGVRMVYIVENNGVYGLTKGQFSASADIGSKSKKGEANEASPIDPVLLALTLGATFVARSHATQVSNCTPALGPSGRAARATADATRAQSRFSSAGESGDTVSRSSRITCWWRATMRVLRVVRLRASIFGL